MDNRRTKQRGSTAIMAIVALLFLGTIIAGLLPMITSKHGAGNADRDTDSNGGAYAHGNRYTRAVAYKDGNTYAVAKDMSAAYTVERGTFNQTDRQCNGHRTHNSQRSGYEL